jgi:hypothetical protein
MFGFVHLYSGQEAVSTGVIRLLRGDDHICSTYRDHVHALSKNVPAREIMAELFGKKTGICRGQGGSMHMFSKKHNLVRCPRQRPGILWFAVCSEHGSFHGAQPDNVQLDRLAVGAEPGALHH